MPISASRLRADIYRVLDEVLRTGQPVEVQRRGRRLKIVPVDHSSRLKSLESHPGAVTGDPADLVDVGWSSEWRS
ncbi:MAG: type II toxin-antitoxin system prevent-host-death family antitoxin [Candidatus Dormibacteria bacterium]